MTTDGLYSPQALKDLISRIETLKGEALATEESHLPKTLASERAVSAANLLHYLAVRRHDIRDLQRELHVRGLSSLGRMEAYTLPSLDAVLRALRALAHLPSESAEADPDFTTGRQLIERNTAAAFGRADPQRSVRIMVTVPSEAVDDPSLIEKLVRVGMDVMRINCSKDSFVEWGEMIRQLRAAEESVGRKCHVLFDLEGPNPRISDESKALRLAPGDTLIIGKGSRPPSMKDSLCVACDFEAVFRDTKANQPIAFDDGRISGRVTEVTSDRLHVEITEARKGRASLKSGKSINLPETDLSVPSLTSKDLADLDFIANEGDLVGFSFVRTAEDVRQLIQEIRDRNADLGIVLKIETRSAFANLPALLLAGLENPRLAVMIARGDMGVELGFDRMAEVQEEILWLCEAAHVPVIWATQVLESLAKKGVPTRGEITDAALSVRADCVMLNKGSYIVETVEFLANLLRRMGQHQDKKRSLLRALSVAQSLS